MGIPAIFLRLTGCNLLCGGKGAEKDGVLRDGATWLCDTIEVWMKGTTWGFEALVEELNEATDFVRVGGKAGRLPARVEGGKVDGRVLGVFAPRAKVVAAGKRAKEAVDEEGGDGRL